MHARNVQQEHRRGLSWLAATSAAVVAFGCGGGGGRDGGAAIEFTPGAMKTLPSYASSGSSQLTAGRSAAASIGDYFFVRQLFSMQCRHPDAHADYCPPGTPAPPATTFDPYQFTMQSLIGFIYHAQMYTSLVTACSGDGLAPRTVTAASYSAASSGAGADPMRFVMDELSSYTCRSTQVSNTAAETRMISAVADGSYQTTLHTRYKYDAGGGPQTDFFQTDVVMNGGSPEFLALNFASATPFASRVVLLANLVTHRFALKYYTPSQPSNLTTWAPARFAVAVGVGGYDLATGTPNAGHYFVDFLDEQIYGEIQKCVDNAGGAFMTDTTACTTEGVPMGWTTSDAISTYLAVPAEHAARLAPFLAKFQTPATLGAADAWAAIGDDDLLWPATLP